MRNFLTKDYIGEPFLFMGTAHLIAMGIIIAICVALYFWKNPSELAKRRFRYGLATILLVNEASWHAWNYFNGIWYVQTLLPLHLCSVLVFLSSFMLITRNYRLYEIMYFLGIGGAMQAVITPDLGIYGLYHIRFLQVFISHGGIIIAAIYMTFVEGLRPHWRSIPRVIGTLSIYAIFVGIVNALIGSNYLFIARKPDTPSLIDVLAPWPFYILELIVLAFVIFGILYLPFAIQDFRKSHQSV